MNVKVLTDINCTCSRTKSLIVFSRMSCTAMAGVKKAGDEIFSSSVISSPKHCENTHKEAEKIHK